MPICPKCSHKSTLIGALCACGQAYFIQENQGNDPLGLLGKQIAKKLIPLSIFRVGKYIVEYEAIQPAIDRRVTFLALKTDFAQHKAIRQRFSSLAKTLSTIRQQNLPTIYEVFELLTENIVGVTCDVRRGKPLTDYLKSNPADDVALVIIHQILQAMASAHRYNFSIPHIGYENVRIMHSGTTPTFVKLYGIIESNLIYDEKKETAADDVFYVGHLALSLLTGEPILADQPKLSPERQLLAPIVQIFLRAVAPPEQRYPHVGELLESFETLLDLNAKGAHPPGMPSRTLPERPSPGRRAQAPVSFDQIAWMHRPPRVDE